MYSPLTLAATLRAVNGVGSAYMAVRRLLVHRNTVRYRLQQITGRYGIALTGDSFDLRFALGVCRWYTAILRASWREVFAEACAGTEAFVILQRGRPEAVRLSEANWLTGCVKVSVPEWNRQRWAVSDVRSSLRAVAHVSGRHTLIRKLYGPLLRDGSDETIDAVIAPCDWVRMSLPELGKFAQQMRRMPVVSIP
ncbi:helix-turn-helix domain-containing protein [Nocardia sp. NPDC059239]|uniref:helix-turn-helix domain-containing protein n=1 Tax=unclassified Nocardia TaxID=2637762 RepID=UPI00369D52B9